MSSAISVPMKKVRNAAAAWDACITNRLSTRSPTTPPTREKISSVGAHPIPTTLVMKALFVSSSTRIVRAIACIWNPDIPSSDPNHR